MDKRIEHGNKVRARLLQYLREHVEEIAPLSFQDICDALGISSKSVVEYHLSILQDEGKIEFGGARNIKVL